MNIAFVGLSLPHALREQAAETGSVGQACRGVVSIYGEPVTGKGH